ncbi:MAG: hypothetical protein QG654_578 [Patescibacteria group bacterium]|nr:hypothetical protein [Patescibacteria group bacterium]
MRTGVGTSSFKSKVNKMMTEKITSNQRKQIVRFVEDGIDAMNLQKDGAQRLIENGGEFQTELKKLIERFSITNQYADEEVESSYGYLSGYTPKGITEQTNRLRELFPGIGYANEKLAEAGLPENAEGWFAIPRWKKVAPTYGQAVQKVLDLIKQTRNGAFYNYREGQLGPHQLRQSAKSVSVFQKLGDEQKDQDILVVPAQFGLRHRGRSVRRAREVMNANECGLGAFAIGIMLLTHPERLQHYDDLWIDCAGDEFAPSAGSGFSESPFFRFSGGRVEFGTDGVGVASDRYGSASVCLPQG